jgi:hypothetical protein
MFQFLVNDLHGILVLLPKGLLDFINHEENLDLLMPTVEFKLLMRSVNGYVFIQ